MKDLLGGQLYTDVDKFAVRDHGASSSMVQNDLDNPNRRIGAVSYTHLSFSY